MLARKPAGIPTEAPQLEALLRSPGPETAPPPAPEALTLGAGGDAHAGARLLKLGAAGLAGVLGAVALEADGVAVRARARGAGQAREPVLAVVCLGVAGSVGGRGGSVAGVGAVVPGRTSSGGLALGQDAPGALGVLWVAEQRHMAYTVSIGKTNRRVEGLAAVEARCCALIYGNQAVE